MEKFPDYRDIFSGIPFFTEEELRGRFVGFIMSTPPPRRYPAPWVPEWQRWSYAGCGPVKCDHRLRMVRRAHPRS